MDDIDFLQSFILVRGKGNKERVVPFGSQVRRTLRRYIMHFRPEPDAPRIGEVFLTEDGLLLKPRAVQSMLLRLSKKAKMSGVRLNPHRFRHTFARQYLVAGGVGKKGSKTIRIPAFKENIEGLPPPKAKR